jgi:hypothetical protein
MKKLILLLLCTATLGLASCKKETLIDPGIPNQTIETTIQANQWVTSTNLETISATLNFPEIDNETFKHDGVQVYIYPDNGINEYTPLPYIVNAVRYSCTVRPGSITFTIQSTDNQDRVPNKPTFPIGVRVVIVTSNLD